MNQVTLFGYNIVKYCINLNKEHFSKDLADLGDITVTEKGNKYMILTTSWFRFFDVCNYLAPWLSQSNWRKFDNSRFQKQSFL